MTRSSRSVLKRWTVCSSAVTWFVTLGTSRRDTFPTRHLDGGRTPRSKSIEFELKVECPVLGRVDLAGATGLLPRVALLAGLGDVLNELCRELVALLLLGEVALASFVPTRDRLVARGIRCDARLVGRASVLKRRVDVFLDRRRCFAQILNLLQGSVMTAASQPPARWPPPEIVPSSCAL